MNAKQAKLYYKVPVAGVARQIETLELERIELSNQHAIVKTNHERADILRRIAVIVGKLELLHTIEMCTIN